MTTKIVTQFAQKLTTSQLNKVIEVANKLGFNPNWLLAVMYFETGRTFSPSVRNNIGSVGLIQFTRDKKGVEYKTIYGTKYYLNDLAKMTFENQMDVVYEYYKPFKNKVKSFLDCYLVTFFPLALGQPNNFVFKTSGLSASLIAKQNPAFDKNKDGQITKDEVLNYFSSLYTKQGFNFDEIQGKTKTGIAVVLGALLVFFYTGFTISQIIA